MVHVYDVLFNFIKYIQMIHVHMIIMDKLLMLNDLVIIWRWCLIYYMVQIMKSVIKSDTCTYIFMQLAD